MISAKHRQPGASWADKLRVESAACLSNEILPDTDQNTLRILIAQAQLELDTFDTEIPRLQALLDNHKERRTTSMERMTRLRMGIAPHKKLPPEIFARIFVELMDQGSVDIPLRGLPLPWVLAQVCSRWRIISRAEPLLWSRLYISTLVTYRRKRSVIPLIEDILSNHGGRGRVEVTIGTLTNGEWNELLHLLQTHSSRMWKLNLTTNTSPPIPALSKPLPLFDEIKSLSLTVTSGSLDQGGQPVRAFSAARSLYELKIKSTYQLVRSGNIDGDMFPWAQLTSLMISSMSSATVLTILTHCSLLLDLTVELPKTKGPNFASVVPLRHLRSMSIAGPTCPHFGEMFAGLTVPSLKRIVLINKSYQSNPFCLDRPLVMNLITLIERSHCDVDSVQTDSLVINPEDIVTLMRAMPALTKWDIPTKSEITESIMSTILEEELAPNLRVLEGWELPSVNSILHFLNSRWSQTTSGNYEGIQHSSFGIRMRNFGLADRAYFRTILPELQTHGRRIQLRMH